jgi:hypothetical protein
MKRIVEASFVVIFLFITADMVRGCVCFELSGKPTPEQARAMLVKDYDKAFAVFSGEVVALDAFKVKLKVDKSWKGDFGVEVIMPTGAKDNDDGTYTISTCDFRFRLGEKYLVYAYGASREEMRARKCTRTRLLKYAEQELRELDEVWPPKQMNRGNEKAHPTTTKSNKVLYRTAR